MDYKKCPNGHYYKGDVCPQCGYGQQPAAQPAQPQYNNPAPAQQPYNPQPQPQYNPQPQPQYNQQQQYNYQQQYNPQPAQPDRPKPENYLVWSIVVTVLCCVPFGVVSIINASKVDSLWAQGQYAEAEEKAANAKKWMFIALGAGFVFQILYIILVVAANL